MRQVSATPFRFPRAAGILPERTALIVIDMQEDFCGKDGYMDRLGGDVAFLSSCVPTIRRVLGASRAFGLPVAHTREGYASDLSDVQPWKMARTTQQELKIGDGGPRGRALIRGEPGWQIVEDLAPLPYEPVFDKNTYGAFASTALETQLRVWGTQHVVLVGVTTDCCVTTTLREALDRGFDCLVLEDCVASRSRKSHDEALSLMKTPSGIFGQVAFARDFIEALSGREDARWSGPRVLK